VYPAAGLVSLHRGLSIEVNPVISTSCSIGVAGRAAEVVPLLVEVVRDSGIGIRDREKHS